MTTYKILITRTLPHNLTKMLAQYPQLSIDQRSGAPLSPNDLAEAVKDCDGLVSVIPDQITSTLLTNPNHKLKLVANYAVGYDNIDLETATKNQIYVSNTPGDLTESVAEFTFGLILALAKNIVDADRYTRGQKSTEYLYWDPLLYLGPKLAGKTLGIIGMGRIGTHLAGMAFYGLKMNIIYTDTTCNSKVETSFKAIRTPLTTLLETADVVSLNCPLLESTKHLIGHTELTQMKPTAYLINTARGPVINEAALYEALKNKWISGAALDVFEHEPQLYPGLKALDNVILTPHIASATREARIEMATMVANNIIDVFIANQPPRNLVNKELAKSITNL